jgi:transposase InsO family protein
VSELRRLRSLHPNLGQDNLHGLLAPWCAQPGIALPSVSPIGRIIARAPDTMCPPRRIDRRGRAQPLRRHTKPKTPKQVSAQALEGLACDTIERIRDGMRRSIVTFIDPVAHVACAVGLPSQHATHTARALQWGLSWWPQMPKTLLSDNGSEFAADVARLLKEHGIGRWYTDPKTPKMNAHVERFNRTIQESFVDYHAALLFTDLALFNRTLADWLVCSNAKRPHHSLGQPSPLSFLLQRGTIKRCGNR